MDKMKTYIQNHQATKLTLIFYLNFFEEMKKKKHNCIGKYSNSKIVKDPKASLTKSSQFKKI